MAENDWLNDDDDTQDQGDGQQDGDGAGGAEPEFTPEQQAFLERKAQERETALLQKVAQSAKAKGLTWSADGGFGIGEVQTFAQEFGLAGGGQQQQIQQQQQQTRQDMQDDVDEGPPEYYDGAAMADWLRKHDERLIKQVTAAIAPEIQKLSTSIQARDQVGIAIQKAKTVLREYGEDYVADHPEFENVYRETLLGTDPNTWGAPQNILGYAGFVKPLLKERGGLERKAQQQQTRQRDDTGRFSREERNQMLGQVAGSREGARPSQGTQRQYSAEEQRFASYFDLGSVEDIEAAGDEFGTARRELAERRKAKAGGRS